MMWPFREGRRPPCTDRQCRCRTVKPACPLQRPVRTAESFRMSQCDLKSEGTLSRGWASSVPPLLREQPTNTSWQAPRRLAHTQKYTEQSRPYSCRNKSSSPTMHTCLKQRCSNACSLYQTGCLVTGAAFHLVCWVQWVHQQQPWYDYCVVNQYICTGYIGFKALAVYDPTVTGAG